MEVLLQQAFEWAALAIESIAAAIIVYGSAEALAKTIVPRLRPLDPLMARRAVWLQYARWLVLALEFELAADIIRTAVAPTWDDLGKLAVIAGIRTVLSVFLERDVKELRSISGQPGEPGRLRPRSQEAS